MSAVTHNLSLARACAHSVKTTVCCSSTTALKTTNSLAVRAFSSSTSVAFRKTDAALGVGRAPVMMCLRCNQPGHRAKECHMPKACYNCGKPGHDAVNCPTPRKCYRCGQPGHTMAVCPQRWTTPHCNVCGGEHEPVDCPHKDKIPSNQQSEQ